MNKLTIKARTLEEAISKAAIELQVTSDKLEYEIAQNGAKGFLGFGAKDFIIEASVKGEQPLVKSTAEDVEETIATVKKELISQEVVDTTRKFIIDVLAKMGVEADINIEIIDEACIKAEIIGKELKIIIGKDGITLDSIQYLASRVASRANDTYVKVKLDADNYRASKRKALEKIAKKAAKNAYENRESVKLKSMNAYDRRLVHACLQNDCKVKTSSEGVEPYRYVVVSPVK